MRRTMCLSMGASVLPSPNTRFRPKCVPEAARTQWRLMGTATTRLKARRCARFVKRLKEFAAAIKLTIQSTLARYYTAKTSSTTFVPLAPPRRLCAVS